MSRTVPPALAAYMAGNGLHMGKLTKMGPLPDGSYRYFSHQSKSYVYDDGSGPATYIGRTGMHVSAFASTADLGVDNAEADTLPPVDGFPLEGFTTEQVKSGELDAVPYVTYCVNYTDLSKGHFIWAGGTIGEQRIKGTALINLEQRSITNKFKQNIVQGDSIHCRAIFGSQALGTGGGVVEEKYPCGYDFSADWVDFTILGTHPLDTDLTFYTNSFAHASTYFRHGMVRMLTGENAGQSREVSTNILASGEQTVTLKYPFPHALAEDDEGEIRWGCDKLPSLATGCRRFHGDDWVLHYRGEPWQPSGDANINLAGGAGVPGPTGGTGENPTGPTAPPPVPGGGGTGTPGTPPSRTIGADTEDANAHGASTGASAATNTAAINAALAALASGGGRVYFSVPGTYNVTVGNTSGLIVISRDNVHLDLDGVTLKAAHSSVTTAPATHQDMIRVDSATQWKITGGQLIGYLDSWVSGGAASSYGISEWAHGIYVTDSSTAGNIEGITISKCVGDGVSIGRTASDIYIGDIAVSNCRRQGISTGGDNIVIEEFDLSYIGTTHPPANGPWAGIDVEVDSPESAADITIRNGRCHHNKGPGVLAVVRTSDITIENVTSDYNQNYGILLLNSDTGTITDCTLEHNKYHGVKADSDSDGWTISGNRFFNNNTSMRGVITTGNTTTLTGTSTATRDHINISSDSSVTVGSNEYGPT